MEDEEIPTKRTIIVSNLATPKPLKEALSGTRMFNSGSNLLKERGTLNGEVVDPPKNLLMAARSAIDSSPSSILKRMEKNRREVRGGEIYVGMGREEKGVKSNWEWGLEYRDNSKSRMEMGARKKSPPSLGKRKRRVEGDKGRQRIQGKSNSLVNLNGPFLVEGKATYTMRFNLPHNSHSKSFPHSSLPQTTNPHHSPLQTSSNSITNPSACPIPNQPPLRALGISLEGIIPTSSNNHQPPLLPKSKEDRKPQCPTGYTHPHHHKGTGQLSLYERFFLQKLGAGGDIHFHHLNNNKVPNSNSGNGLPANMQEIQNSLQTALFQNKYVLGGGNMMTPITYINGRNFDSHSEKMRFERMHREFTNLRKLIVSQPQKSPLIVLAFIDKHIKLDRKLVKEEHLVSFLRFLFEEEEAYKREDELFAIQPNHSFAQILWNGMNKYIPPSTLNPNTMTNAELPPISPREMIFSVTSPLKDLEKHAGVFAHGEMEIGSWGRKYQEETKHSRIDPNMYKTTGFQAQKSSLSFKSRSTPLNREERIKSESKKKIPGIKRQTGKLEQVLTKYIRESEGEHLLKNEGGGKLVGYSTGDPKWGSVVEHSKHSRGNTPNNTSLKRKSLSNTRYSQGSLISQHSGPIPNTSASHTQGLTLERASTPSAHRKLGLEKIMLERAKNKIEVRSRVSQIRNLAFSEQWNMRRNYWDKVFDSNKVVYGQPHKNKKCLFQDDENIN